MQKMLVYLFFGSLLAACTSTAPKDDSKAIQLLPKTVVSIKGNQFYLNGTITYKDREWEGHKIEGLLMNSRMVQGIFDDANPETRDLFVYPDTKTWDPDRNTNEFVAAMPDWYAHGLLAFTLNLQGGSPTGYGNKNWYNSTFDKKGYPKPAYLDRLDRILKKADELGMVSILGYFYFGQDQFLEDEAAVINAVDQMTDWLLQKGYQNILVEVNNECDVNAYDHDILKPERVHELIERVRDKSLDGRRLLVGTSFKGNAIPTSNVAKVSDFILIHGNGVSDPNRITEMVAQTKLVEGYKGQPILFNEDDHYDYNNSENNMAMAVKAYASWGYFDFRRKDETDITIGYQSVPVDWRINSERKMAFFNQLKMITGK
ncbi:MAG: hypothetical protein R2828_28890 [Saprospiraceae bacterium]